jgi:hypothetical protein
MFSISKNAPHSIRKRMLSNVYSKSYIMNSTSMTEMTKVLLFDRLLPILASFAKSSAEVDMYSQLSAATMDFTTSYLFGLASCADVLRNQKQWKHFEGLYHSRHTFNFWPQELPSVTPFLKRIGLRVVPKWVDAANDEIEAWALKMSHGASHTMSTWAEKKDEVTRDKLCDVPVVYSQLQSALERNDISSNTSEDAEAYHRLTIASETLDHMAAGFETSGITLTYFVHEISKRPNLQKALREELRTLDPPLSFPTRDASTGLPTAKDVDTLPLLQAILQETLRLHSAIPGLEPRITPVGGCVLGPDGEYKIPGGVRVSANPHCLHRNSDVFEDPEEWKPERWLKPAGNEQLREMMRWFWAFSSGGRKCVGSNFAIYRKCLSSAVGGC